MRKVHIEGLLTMPDLAQRRRTPLVAALTVFVAILVLRCDAWARQLTPNLAITAPADGAVVAPGETIAVTVTSPAGLAFVAVALIGEQPMGIAGAATTVPAQFSIEVPARTASRKYDLTAFARTNTGEEFTAEIQVDVQRPDMPTQIESAIPEIMFEAPGEFSTIRLVARFVDDTVMDVTESSLVTYATSDPDVATVSARGMVTAVAAGEAEITATYGPPANKITKRIVVLVPPPVFEIAPSSLDLRQSNRWHVGVAPDDADEHQSRALEHRRRCRMRLLKPDGTQLAIDSLSAANFNLSMQTLPASGNFTVVVNPTGATTGTVNIAVTNP